MTNYTSKEGKTIVTWLSVDETGKGSLNVRKFPKQENALSFIDAQLPSRGVVEVQVKTTHSLHLNVGGTL